MKLGVQNLLLLSVCIMLWGCPYCSPYGIDAAAQQDIEEGLIGNWGTLVNKPSDEMHPTADSVKICFTKYTDQEYTIAITGGLQELRPLHCLENDTIKGTAYLSTIAQKQFLNAFIKGRMYIAEVTRNTDGLSIKCLAERFTARYIRSSEQLKNSIAFHYKVAISPAYDDFFVLNNLQKLP